MVPGSDWGECTVLNSVLNAVQGTGNVPQVGMEMLREMCGEELAAGKVSSSEYAKRRPDRDTARRDYRHSRDTTEHL